MMAGGCCKKRLEASLWKELMKELPLNGSQGVTPESYFFTPLAFPETSCFGSSFLLAWALHVLGVHFN
jgi:hypothetical protein